MTGPVSATANGPPEPGESPYVAAVFVIYVLLECFVDITSISAKLARYAVKFLPMLAATILIMLMRRHWEHRADFIMLIRRHWKTRADQKPPARQPRQQVFPPEIQRRIDQRDAWARREYRQRTTRARPTPPMIEARYVPPPQSFDEDFTRAPGEDLRRRPLRDHRHGSRSTTGSLLRRRREHPVALEATTGM